MMCESTDDVVCGVIRGPTATIFFLQETDKLSMYFPSKPLDVFIKIMSIDSVKWLNPSFLSCSSTTPALLQLCNYDCKTKEWVYGKLVHSIKFNSLQS